MEPGIYDNRRTFRREVWEHIGGTHGPIVLVEWRSAEMLYDPSRPDGVQPFGHFPDLPKD